MKTRKAGGRDSSPVLAEHDARASPPCSTISCSRSVLGADDASSRLHAKLNTGVLWSLNVKYVSESAGWMLSNDLFAAFIKRGLLQ
jgi:hypothetical protein